ncbi:hypothetical protein DVA43_00740 [Leclercia sp. W6]|uniref:hypothetical protein n=1 Tax=Leclercia sp. W6 TaxID=2282310 RepID=UPI000DF2F531|nr:hypothetical protein [Leclercia sp. W6]AXF58190.1 hypothetical protein DVA43_00740 [Leclercia sp. W6]
MAEFTKEQLIAEVRYNLEHCFCSEKTKRLMEIALAALTAEPVAHLVCNGRLYQDRAFLSFSTAQISVKDRNDGAEIKPLYRLPLLEGFK